jgi:UDP-N-acetylmuramoylalanine--D-glutamate ligase
MTIDDLKGKKITVMGLGVNGGGEGIARFLSEAGALVTVTDIESKEKLAPSLEKLKKMKNITYILGQHRPEDFTQADMVIKNPAAPWSNKYIKLALEKNIPVEMDSSLFFKFCKNQIIGITGTKGKTTTASLIYEILKTAGIPTVKVGISQISVLDKLKDLKKDSVVVFELSSWRLSALGKNKFSPQIAVITNVYPDHLNYYKTMEEYIRDKKNIFLYQKKEDTCIINGDNEITKQLEKEIKSRVMKFSKNKINSGQAVYADNKVIYFNNGIDEKKIMETEKIKLKGEHNLENILAAIAVAVVLGIEIEKIKKAVTEFSGVAYRLELVRELDGVKYINDSAATMPEAVIYGIKSFSEPVVLICGGSDKKLNMAELARVILEKTKKTVFLKGSATDKMILEMKKINNGLQDGDFKIALSMEEAVNSARDLSETGDVVLLSPGAASFGMFRNEFDRGEKFRKAVLNLK